MVDAKRLLDELVGGKGDPQSRRTAQPIAGSSVGDLARKAKDFLDRNPGLAEAALSGVATLLLGSRRGRAITRGLAVLGGLAVIGGVALDAFRKYRAGEPIGAQGRASNSDAGQAGPAFDPATVSEEDALLFVRAMVAAAISDGHVDDAERDRIMSALAQANLDQGSARWLERELAEPADVDELADRVDTPEKAAQVYAAARVAIDPDTIQEREFLHRLAQALDLDPKLRTHIDEAASGAKVSV